jgi:hypothetical protein
MHEIIGLSLMATSQLVDKVVEVNSFSFHSLVDNNSITFKFIVVFTLAAWLKLAADTIVRSAIVAGIVKASLLLSMNRPALPIRIAT